MKKFILNLFKLIFSLIIIVIIFLLVCSKVNNISIEDTVSYIKSIGTEVLDTIIQEEIPTNTSVDYTQIISSSNKHFYYEQLDNNGKIIYSAFEKNIDNLKKENYVIDFSNTFNDLLHESIGQYKLNYSFQSALDAFFYDHPEIFYIDITKISLVVNSLSLGPVTTYKVQIVPKNNKNYLSDNFNSEQEVDIAIKKIENIKEKILNDIKSKNLYNKILTIHDMLVNSISYGQTDTLENAYNIYGALVEKKVVCEGYAKAFKYLMDAINIECILVNGWAVNSADQNELHMWNHIRLNDNWYGVDVTWDDPVVIGGTSSNMLRHSYFLKGSHTFIHSHSATGKISDSGMIFDIPPLSNNNYTK